MEMLADWVGGHHQGFPRSLLPGFLSNREPQPLLVLHEQEVRGWKMVK